jgi:hypothetical protein
LPSGFARLATGFSKVLRQEFCFRNKRFGGQLQGLGGGRMKLYENQKGARKILFIQTFVLGVVVRFLPLSDCRPHSTGTVLA